MGFVKHFNRVEGRVIENEKKQTLLEGMLLVQIMFSVWLFFQIQFRCNQ